MTVKELIEQLQTLDPDLHVFVQGYEGGYNDIDEDHDILEIAFAESVSLFKVFLISASMP